MYLHDLDFVSSETLFQNYETIVEETGLTYDYEWGSRYYNLTLPVPDALYAN